MIASSAGCAFNRRPAIALAPVAFTAPPTLPEIIEVVNANSMRVQQLHAEDIRLTIPGRIGSLRARLDFERPNHFRLVGETRLTGREIDLGSNDTSFWLWARQVQPPTVFHGQHAQFFQSAARQVLPVPPNWLIEALGVVYLDPHGLHEVHASTKPGLVQIQSRIPSARGELLRLLEIDQQRGWVVEQHLFGADHQLLASALASDFQYDPLQSVSLPRRIQVDLPPAALSLTLEVPSYVVNQPAVDPLALFSMPQLPNHQYRDVANPSDMQGLVPFGGASTSSTSSAPRAISPGITPDFNAQRSPAATVSVPTPPTAWRRFRPFSILR